VTAKTALNWSTAVWSGFSQSLSLSLGLAKYRSIVGPNIFHVESIWNPWNRSIPCGVHMKCGGIVKYCLNVMLFYYTQQVLDNQKNKNTDKVDDPEYEDID